MPTTTVTTMATPSALSPTIESLKVYGKSPASVQAALPTLRALYPRATHAFLQRDLSQTQSFVDSAFKLLKSPSSSSPVDAYSSQRRKWDILRITLATTTYTSPPGSPHRFDQKRRQGGLQRSPVEFIEQQRASSSRLFTPLDFAPTSTYLPPQIVLLLAVSAVKLDTLLLAREIIEDWLTKREHEILGDVDVYEKIIEVYCLHVLSRLRLWEDAREFLKFESELSIPARERISATLESEHLKATTPKRGYSNSRRRDVSTTPKRTPSPNGSISSASSESTHTATPATPRQRDDSRPSSAASTSTSGTIKPSRHGTLLPLTSSTRPVDRSITPPPLPASLRSRSPAAPLPKPPVSQPSSSAPITSRSPSIFTLVRVSVSPYLAPIRSNLYTIFCIIIPLIVLLYRYTQRTRSAGVKPASAALAARNRLAAGKGTTVWSEIVRVVADTVGMAGRGLI